MILTTKHHLSWDDQTHFHQGETVNITHRDMFQPVVFQKKKSLKPHPGIVTVLWSITVTSPRCLNCVDFSDWVLEWLSGIFIFYQNLAHDLSHAERSYLQVPVPAVGAQSTAVDFLFVFICCIYSTGKRRLLEPALPQKSRMSGIAHHVARGLW